MAVQRFRKKPVVIEAIRWTGDNEEELVAFAGANFETVHDSPEWTARVYDALHDSWIAARTGDWIVRGVRGENYAVHQDVLDETYDLITEEGD